MSKFALFLLKLLVVVCFITFAVLLAKFLQYVVFEMWVPVIGFDAVALVALGVTFISLRYVEMVWIRPFLKRKLANG